jgi:hypothetical protein
MMFPFSHQFDKLFRSDRSIWWKVFGGVTAIACFVLHDLAWNKRNGMGNIVCSLILTLIVAPAAVIYLEKVDRVGRRIEVGERIGWLDWLFFSGGLGSLLVWLVTILIVCPTAIILVLAVLDL